MRRFIGGNNHRGRPAPAFARLRRACGHLHRRAVLLWLALGGGCVMVIAAPGVDFQAEVARALGTSPAGMVHMCSNRHGRTKRFAKFKPTIWTGGVPRQTTAPYSCVKYQGQEYWQADDGFCGFRIPLVNGVALTSDNLIGSDWEYMAPQGGASQPCHSGFWMGYNNEAVAPYTVTYPTANVYIGEEADILFIDQSGAANQLTLPEIVRNINPSGGVYIGVMVESGSLAPQFYTSANVMGSDFGGNFGLRVKFMAASNKCTLFITDRPASGGALPSAARCYPFYSEAVRQATVTAVTRPAYVDHYKIASWDLVEVGYNYIRFTATLGRSDGLTGGGLYLSDLLLWYNLRDEYGNNIVTNREAHWGATNREYWTYGTQKTLTIYLDEITTRRSWSGGFGLEVIAGNGQYDALGGYQVSYDN